MINQINEATEYLKKKGIKTPEVGVILGTGLGNKFVEQIRNPIAINYNSIPHFPISTVEFHKGKLIYGDVKGKKVLAMQGRFHYYEGYTMQQITLPVRVMKMMGVKQLLISNAAGNMNMKWKKGELMLIDDHINLLPDNPLRGPNFEVFGPRFPDMSQPYSKKLNDLLAKIAKAKKIKLNKGVYVAVMGPNLETRAEYRFLNRISLPCCAISVLTDDCDPDNLKPASITEIVAVAGKAESKLTELYVELIAKI
jgi:purine-nucleoside phosphorylase